MKGNLYLIPTLLGNTRPDKVLASEVLEITGRLSHFIVEDIRSARRFLKKAVPSIHIDSLDFYELNKRTSEKDLAGYLAPANGGNDIGLLSEAGAPCVADPGSNIALLAHNSGIRVIPLVGPSSIILALMASGMNGQNFSFHGYLPVKKKEREKVLKKLENDSLKTKRAHIFMETPYRNTQMIESITKTCNPSTKLCIACDITMESEYILTLTIEEWRKNKPDINKHPAIYIIN